jgi:hypothetical protein
MGKWARYVLCVWYVRNVHNIFFRKPEVKRPLRRPKHRWENDIDMDIREIGLGWDWILPAEDMDW